MPDRAPAKRTSRIPRAQSGELRAVADHELAAAPDRQGEERLEVLLDRDPADVEVDRPRQGERRRVVGRNSSTSTPRDQSLTLVKPFRLELAPDRRGRDHHALGRPVEPAHPGVAEPERHGPAGADVFRKAGVVGGRERQAALDALPAGREPERALGRDVDAVGPTARKPRPDPAARAQRQADLRIARAGQRPELVRRDHLDLDGRAPCTPAAPARGSGPRH